MKKLGFIFKLAKPKKVVNKPVRISNKLVEGICFKENGVWKIEVELDEGTNMCLEFTPASYSLRRKVVFAKEKPEHADFHMFIRNQDREWKHGPGLDTQYTPFAEHFVYKGYIVRIGDKRFFDMVDLVGRHGNQKV